jgi:hypothetical protein
MDYWPIESISGIRLNAGAELADWAIMKSAVLRVQGSFW